MSYTEVLHYEMIFWKGVDEQRHLSAFGKVSELRLLRVESVMNEDIV